MNVNMMTPPAIQIDLRLTNRPEVDGRPSPFGGFVNAMSLLEEPRLTKSIRGNSIHLGGEYQIRNVSAILHLYQKYGDDSEMVPPFAPFQAKRFPHKCPHRATFIYACSQGNMDFVKWAVEKRPSLMTTEEKEQTSFYEGVLSGVSEACQEGHFELAQWLCALLPRERLCKPYVLQGAYQIAMLRGHVDVVKWLLTLHQGGTTLLIPGEGNHLFKRLTSKNPAMLRLVLEMVPEVRLSAYQAVFDESCRHGRLDLAQWVYEKKPEMDLEKGFVQACEMGSTARSVVDWICGVNKRFHILQERPNVYMVFGSEVAVATESSEEPTCGICLEKAEVKSVCGHTFCRNCITEWNWNHACGTQCPTCRKVIWKKEFYLL